MWACKAREEACASSLALNRLREQVDGARVTPNPTSSELQDAPCSVGPMLARWDACDTPQLGY